MKTPDQTEVKPSALLDALLSVAIIAANNPTVQKTMPVVALALGYVAGAWA